MTDHPRTGPPPEKEEAATQGWHPGQRRDFTSNSSAKNTTAEQATKGLSAAARNKAYAEAETIRCYDDLVIWASRHDIPMPCVLQCQLDPLHANGAAAWIAIDFCGIDDDDFALAIPYATDLIIAPDNVDPWCREAAELAAMGRRVVVMEAPREGCTLPLIPWGPSLFPSKSDGSA